MKNILKTTALLFTFSILLFQSYFASAQVPQTINYQAIARNSSGTIMANQSVSVEIRILQGSSTGTQVCDETFATSTNDFGLINLQIGSQDPTSFAAIDWANGPYWIEVSLDGTLFGTSQLVSVPYALHSATADSLSGFSETDPIFGASIAAVITGTDTSNWNNKLDTEVDGSITNEIQILTISNDTIYLSNGGFAKLPAGFDGNYSSLTGAPTNVSAFTNDAGYLTSFTEVQILSISNDTIYLTGGSFVKLPTGFDGDYNSLVNKPDFTGWDTNAGDDFDGQYSSLSGTPTNVSAFTNDAGYLTSFTEAQILSISNDTIYLTGGSFVKLPAGFDGNYSSLTGAPTNVSAFTNDAGYLTAELDNDPTNEIQTLSVSGTDLTISGGNTVTIPNTGSLWSDNGSDVYRSSGNVGIGISSPQSSLHIANTGGLYASLQFTNGNTGSNATDGFIIDNYNENMRFLNQENTDMYFLTNNTLRMTIRNSGYIGIGTATPTQTLHVSKSEAGNYVAKFENTHTTDAPVVAIKTSVTGGTNAALSVTDGNNDPLFFVRSDGNVGIGTGTPAVNLEMVSRTGEDVTLMINQSQTTQMSRIELSNQPNSTSGSGNEILFTEGLGNGSSGNSFFSFHHSSSSNWFKLRTKNSGGSYIDIFQVNEGSGNIYFTGGNVGIGTTSPGNKLEVENTSGSSYITIDANTSSDADAGIAFNIENTHVATMRIDDSDGDKLQLFTNGLSENGFTIDQSGYVGIGTTNPQADLHVAGGGQFHLEGLAADMYFINTGGSKTGRINYDSNGDMVFITNSPVESMRMKNDGKIGIGISSPSSRLDISNGGANNSEVMLTLRSGADQFKIIDVGDGDYALIGNDNNGSYFKTVEGASGITGAEIHLTNMGNVGIGTSSPVETFHVYDAGNTFSIIESSDNNDVGIKFIRSSSANGDWMIYNSGGKLHFGTDNDLLSNAPTNIMTIADASTSVGINESTPASTLDVNGTFQIQNGTSINEISTDGALSGNSNDAVPTEQAVKTYVDNSINSAIPTYAVGDFAHGGIVIWVDASGQHGVVCAKQDIGGVYRWYAGTDGNTQAKADGPRAGAANTTIIISAQVAIGDDGNTYAARICNELQITEGGTNYCDWYLPSKEELALMYSNKAIIDATALSNGGTAFMNDTYWSSTENNSTTAWTHYFLNGLQVDRAKSTNYNIRPVRAF